MGSTGRSGGGQAAVRPAAESRRFQRFQKVPEVPEGSRSSRRFQKVPEVLQALLQQLGPAPLQEAPQPESGTADLRVVLIEPLTVIKNQSQVREEGLRVWVPENRENVEHRDISYQEPEPGQRKASGSGYLRT